MPNDNSAEVHPGYSLPRSTAKTRSIPCLYWCITASEEGDWPHLEKSICFWGANKTIHEILSWRTRTPTNIDSKFRHEHLCLSLCFCCGLGADKQVVLDSSSVFIFPLFKVNSVTVKFTGCTAQRVWFFHKMGTTQALSTPTSPQIRQRVFTFSKGRQKFGADGQCRSCGCLAEGYSLQEYGSTKHVQSVCSPFSNTHSNDFDA